MARGSPSGRSPVLPRSCLPGVGQIVLGIGLFLEQVPHIFFVSQDNEFDTTVLRHFLRRFSQTIYTPNNNLKPQYIVVLGGAFGGAGGCIGGA